MLEAIRKTDGVTDVHHVHAWSLTSGRNFATPWETVTLASAKGVWDAIFILNVVWSALLLYVRQALVATLRAGDVVVNSPARYLSGGFIHWDDDTGIHNPLGIERALYRAERPREATVRLSIEPCHMITTN